MRKIGFLLFALALVAGACGGEDSSSTASPAPVEPAEAPAPAPSPDPAPAEPTAPPQVNVDALPELTLSVGHSGAPDGFADIASVKFKEIIEERSQGKISVEVFPSGQLGGERELVEGAQIGSVDVAVVLAGIMESFVPEFGVLNLPYLFDDRDHVFATLDGPVGEDLLALLDGVDLKGLAFGEFGFRSMMTAPRPISVPADLNGIKIRVPESDLYINTMELLGATPTPIPGPEIFTSLQNGVVDATEAPIFAAVTQKYYETPLEHLSLTEHIYAALMMVGSQDMWERVGPEGQEIIKQAALEAVAHQRQRSIEDDAGYIAELSNQGWSITEVDKAPFRDAVAPLYDANPGLAGWVERIRGVVGGTSPATDVDALPELTLSVGHSGAPDGFADIASVKFKEIIEERSQGKISVEVFPSGQLGGERELVEGAQIGSVDVAVVLAGIMESFVPEFGVLNLPYLFDDRDHVFATLDGPVGEDLLALLDGVDLKGLAFGEFGFRSMMTAPRPISVPADLNGIKIRVPESDLYINTMELLGATPTPIPGPEIFTSLQNGVVDATEAPIFAAVTQKYYETPLEHLSLTEHIYAALMMVGSQDMWERVGPEGQEIIKQAALEAVAHQRQRSIEDDAGYIAELSNQGWSITEVDKAPFRDAVAPLYDANPGLAGWVERIRGVAG
ncbi:MAG: TRAP transporter substrate-binding protein [Acidimicrobiia bacterium]|nr:TRAP transporter substrate-binding protein [Acidimicrobiia bacterium]MYJ13807.1 TRAP transporter substrate-binding protein [Acidimicrobiia bacterium]